MLKYTPRFLLCCTFFGATVLLSAPKKPLVCHQADVQWIFFEYASYVTAISYPILKWVPVLLTRKLSPTIQLPDHSSILFTTLLLFDAFLFGRWYSSDEHCEREVQKLR